MPVSFEEIVAVIVPSIDVIHVNFLCCCLHQPVQTTAKIKKKEKQTLIRENKCKRGGFYAVGNDELFVKL